MSIQKENQSSFLSLLSGNQVCAKISHYLSDAMFVYPITPSTGASEYAERLVQQNAPNIFNQVPKFQQMQSEAGSISGCHGASHAGASATTFTSSQGLLLMIPDIIKMVGERKPAVIQVAARSIARATLNIYGDHSDVMQLRSTGAVMICSTNQAECAFNSVLSYLLTFKLRVPVIHFYDGFQTSHEMQSVKLPSKDDLQQIWNNYEQQFNVLKAKPQQNYNQMQNAQSLTEQAITVNNQIIGTHPGSIGLVSNDDTHFQLSLGLKHELDQCPEIIAQLYKFLNNEFTKRQIIGLDAPVTLCLKDYNICGQKQSQSSQAYSENQQLDKYQKVKHVIIGMGSAMDILQDRISDTEAILKISSFRPLDTKKMSNLLLQLPNLQNITIIERNLEYNSQQILYQDVVTGLIQEKFPLQNIHFSSGIHGIGGKELSENDADTILQYFKSSGKANFFTVGVIDDVGLTDIYTLLNMKNEYLNTKNLKNQVNKKESKSKTQCSEIALKFYGIGSEGFVKAAEVLAQLLQEQGDQVQKMSYFDAKKSGGLTESDVRAGKYNGIIKQHNRIQQADGIIISRWKILESDPEILRKVKPGGVVLMLNQDNIYINKSLIDEIVKNKIMIYSFDVESYKQDNNLPNSFKANFHSVLLLQDLLKINIGPQIQKKYKQLFPKSPTQLPSAEQLKNYLRQIKVNPLDKMSQASFQKQFEQSKTQNVIGEAIAQNKGNKLPVSSFMDLVRDPTMRNGTASSPSITQYGISQHVAKFLPEECIECGRCAVVCPHGVIQAALLNESEGNKIKKLFAKITGKKLEKLHKVGKHDYFLAVNEKGCTGCAVCVHECPTKALKIDKVEPSNTIFEEISQVISSSDYKKRLPRPSTQPKALQFSHPFSTCHSACQGCGETAYINLLGKTVGNVKGKHIDIVQGTGCPLVYLGQIGCQPLQNDAFWTNSLFENTAEVALGLNKVTEAPTWAIMGDGAAIDIDFGGLSFVLSKKNNVKCLVLDTNGYSNTGGQYSSTSLPGTQTSLATKGVNETPKDLFKIGIMHGNCYVATVTMENPTRTAKIFQEAQKFDGPALIIAYSPCISSKPEAGSLDSVDQMRKATKSGIFPLMVYDPRKEQGKRLVIESKKEDNVDILHEGRVVNLKELQSFTDKRWDELQNLAKAL